MFQSFVDPSLTKYEAEKLRLGAAAAAVPPEEAQQLLDIIEIYSSTNHHDK